MGFLTKGLKLPMVAMVDAVMWDFCRLLCRAVHINNALANEELIRYSYPTEDQLISISDSYVNCLFTRKMQ